MAVQVMFLLCETVNNSLIQSKKADFSENDSFLTLENTMDVS